jgi:hypothetical protein
VQATKQILTERAKSTDTLTALDVRVSAASRDRAFRLLSALLHACEDRGFSAKATARKGSLLVVKGEPLQFSLEEASKRVMIPPSKRANDWSAPYELVPTGKLVFRLHEYWAEGLRKSWADGAKRSLEEQLNDIIPALVDVGLVVREERIEQEKQQAAWAEQARLRALKRRGEGNLILICRIGKPQIV